MIAMFSFRVNILYVSMRSLFFLLVFSVLSPRYFSLSPYSSFFSLGTIFVVAHCTCSRHWISPAKCGDHACTQYFKCGLT